MERIDRQGLDRLNENVHNFPITLLARGGLVTLFIYIYMYTLILLKMKKKQGTYYIMPFFLPVFLIHYLM